MKMSTTKLDLLTDAEDTLRRLYTVLNWGNNPEIKSLKKLTTTDIERLTLIMDEAVRQLKKEE